MVRAREIDMIPKPIKPDTGGGPVDDKWPTGKGWPTPPHHIGGIDGSTEIV
jgi:hypothetical protein